MSLSRKTLEAAFLLAGRPFAWGWPLNHLCLAEELYRFLTAFSVRPGRNLEISHQRVPKNACGSGEEAAQ